MIVLQEIFVVILQVLTSLSAFQIQRHIYLQIAWQRTDIVSQDLHVVILVLTVTAIATANVCSRRLPLDCVPIRPDSAPKLCPPFRPLKCSL